MVTISRRKAAARWTITVLTTLIASVGVAMGDAPALSMIHTDGAKFIDASNQPVTLKGCNLGNLLMLESWMFGDSLNLHGKNFKDQSELFATMNERFGADRTRQLIEDYRDAYITARDFDLIKSFGFNLVRLPFDYRLLQDDASPGGIRPDAFTRLDKEVALAEAAGVYVVLDMHGVPGGQSIQDHTGKLNQNKLWNDADDQDRTVMLWKAMAEHYKDRSAVAAYDLINEPYGNMRDDVRPQLAALLPKIAKAVRGTGDQHVMFFPGALNGGIAFYGDPHAQSFEGVGFTEHYYPGLFGSKSAMETHARLLGAELPAKEAYLQSINTPYFVGEFNVVLESEEPNRIMRSYYDRFGQYGWACTMWSYKLLSANGGVGKSDWYMVTNADPLPKLDAAECSFEDLDKFFTGLATDKIAVNEDLRTAITDPHAEPLPLAKYAPLPAIVPNTPQSNPAGYASADIGGATTGHTAVMADGKVQIIAGGSDINGTRDSFRFVSQPVSGSVDVVATLLSMSETNQWAKAGVMARWGDSEGAAMAMLNVFPDGSLALMGRPIENGSTAESHMGAVTFPVQLKLHVEGGHATASYRSTRGEWRDAGSVDVPADDKFLAGVAVCAHADAVLNTVTALLDGSDGALPMADAADKKPAGPSLLKNGSFETVSANGADQAADWNRWGDWMNREDSWSPTHDGKCMIGYHHWQVEGKGGSSGWWQDVKVKTGERYTFTIYAQHDAADEGKHNAKTLELRLESVTAAGQTQLNTQEYQIDKLATGKDWTQASVSGTATSDTLRVLAVIDSSTETDRGGAVKLDDATLTKATDGK